MPNHSAFFKFATQGSDLALFVSNGTKVKIPFEIEPPLVNNYPPKFLSYSLSHRKQEWKWSDNSDFWGNSLLLVVQWIHKKNISKGEKSDQNHLFGLEFLKDLKTDLFAFSDSVNVVETLDNNAISVTFFSTTCHWRKLLGQKLLCIVKKDSVSTLW